MNEFEPTSIELEALHLAGQLELVEVQNKLLDRYVDLNMELPE